MKKLIEILNNIDFLKLSGMPEGIEITGITNDSREVIEGSIFVAVKGYKTDGHNFLRTAIENGAYAVVIDDESWLRDDVLENSPVVEILVGSSRKALAQISNIYFDRPSAKLKLIGITGTKGKTTTAFIIKHVLESAGYKSGLLGTIANFIGKEKYDTKLTTPESHKINLLLDKMVRAGCSFCVMEVSSHSLFLNRADELDFDAAVFTNLESDHMDFHSTRDEYLSAKKILFDMLKPGAVMILNGDDPASDYLAEKSRGTTKYFSSIDDSDYTISNIKFDFTGTKFDLTAGGIPYKVSTELIGKFNAYNAAAAFGAADSFGIPRETIIRSIGNVPHVPGRFEVLKRDDKIVIVDYSHTAESLEKALLTIEALTKNEKPIYTVFGCGGDRDKFKRPIMGGIATEHSRQVVITSDNPRTEDPFLIIDDIKKGIKTDNFSVIENREEAIKYAVCESPENAVVLIGGKGHESYQEINNVRAHFSDKETAEKYLKL